MENWEFCRRVNFFLNANRVKLLKFLILLYIGVERFKIVNSDAPEIKKIDSYKEFWCKMLFFNQKTKINILKNQIFATHGLLTIFNKCSKFQNDPINSLGYVTS